MILIPSPTLATVCAILLGFVIFISTPSLFTPAHPPARGHPQKVAVILTLYWTGAYTLQMIIYALVVHLVNLSGERSWYNAMLFTALYSLTFLVGTFLLPDFDRPKGCSGSPPAAKNPRPKISHNKNRSDEGNVGAVLSVTGLSPSAVPPDRPRQ